MQISVNGVSTISGLVSSTTTLVFIRNTRVFRAALMARTEPHTHWQWITCFMSPRQWVTLHIYLRYYAPGMWWRIRTIRTTCVLQSSQRLQCCCSCLHNSSPCLCLAPAECHIYPHCYCYISDAALSPYICSLEMLQLITMQSSIWIHRLPLHLLRHYPILQVWNMLSNLHTV